MDPVDQFPESLSDEQSPRWLRTALVIAGTAVCVLTIALLVAVLLPRDRKPATTATAEPSAALVKPDAPSSEAAAKTDLDPPDVDRARETPDAAATTSAPASGARPPGPTDDGQPTATPSAGTTPLASPSPADPPTAGVASSSGQSPATPGLTTSPGHISRAPSPGMGAGQASSAPARSGTAPSSGSGGPSPAAGGAASGNSGGAPNASGASNAASPSSSGSPAGAGNPAGGAAGTPASGANAGGAKPDSAGGASGPSGSVRVPRPAPRAKQPPPPGNARAAALARIRADFVATYAQATLPSGKRSLALELFRRSFAEPDAAKRYALLDEFCTLATAAGDWQLAATAVRELEEGYLVDGWARKKAILEQLLEQAATDEQRRALVERTLGLALHAADARAMDTARDLHQLATAHAKKIKDTAAQRTLLAQAKQLDTRWGALREAAELQLRYQRAPNDSSVNFQLGRSLCLSESDWNTGLKHLTRGNDRALANLAALDLAAGQDDGQRAQLANQWYEQARLRKTDLKTRDLCLARARALYRELQPRVRGDARAFVEQRLKELTAGLPVEAEVSAVRPTVTSLPWLNGPAGELRTFDGHQKNITALAVSPDGTVLVSASEDLTVQAWQLENGGRRWTAQVQTANAHGLAFSGDGRLVVANYDNNRLLLWQVDHGKVAGEIPTSNRSPTDIAVLPDNRRVIWGCRAQPPNIAVWDVTAKQAWGQFGDGDTPTVLELTADGRLLATADSHGMLRVWHVETGLLLREFRVHDDAVTDLSLSPDGSVAATATFGQIRVTELDSGRRLGTLTVPNIRTVAFSPDGRRLVTGGSREEVFLWNLDSGERLPSLRAEAAFSDNTILRLAFLPDPRGLVTGATGGKLRLWKLPD
jgi:hypothetical protein